MREDEVYSLTKKWFLANEFKLLAGQPPRGTDRIPVLEIKSSNNQAKGSKGSYKPDLLVANSEVVVLVECKPIFSKSDVIKLAEISENSRRQSMLFNEMFQRGLLIKHGLDHIVSSSAILSQKLRYCIAYSGEFVPLVTGYSLVVSEKLSFGDLFLGDLGVHSFT